MIHSATGYAFRVITENWDLPQRPRSRADCLTAEQIKRSPWYNPEKDPTPADGHNCERPCPWVSCRYHLYLEVHPETGAVKLNFKGMDVWDMKETCALDVADAGTFTLREVGDMFDLTRERIRQLETKGMRELHVIVKKITDID